jgi:hypothetical protein
MTTTKSRKAGSATLASMVPATPVAPETASAAVSAVAAPAPTAPPAIDWDSIDATPTIAVYTRNEPATIDREASTPLFIKNSVAFAYEAHMNAGNDKPVWVTLSLPNAEAIEQFMKLARLYSKFKGYTIRGGENPKVSGEVRYMVKPKELRTKAATPSPDGAV